MSPTPAENGTHTPKELELMGKLKSFEEDRVKFVEIVRNKVKKLEGELDVSMSLCRDVYSSTVISLSFHVFLANELMKRKLQFNSLG